MTQEELMELLKGNLDIIDRIFKKLKESKDIMNKGRHR
jgi:hypothetical protein